MNLANKISDAADQVMGVVAGFWKPEGGEVDIEVASVRSSRNAVIQKCIRLRMPMSHNGERINWQIAGAVSKESTTMSHA